MSDYTVVEICAGAGGQSLGLDRAGFKHELAIDLDPTAAATLQLNKPEWDVRIGDVADPEVWLPSDFGPENRDEPISLFAGGVPCPPFSIAGKQLGAEDERDLFAWAIEQVAVLRPRAVLLENVKGLSQARFAGYRQHVLDRLFELGYEAEWRLLNAADFGVPQLRPRFVLVAMEPEYFPHFHWPEGKKKHRSVGQALKSLMAENGWEGAEAWAKSANKVGPTIVGGSKKHGGADLGPTRAKAAWAALGVDGKGVADTPPQAGDTFDVGPRLTLEMVKRIQGWNDREFKWKFEGRKTSVYRQIGNAFPPPVAKALGVSIKAALDKKTPKRAESSVQVHADAFVKALKEAGGFMSGDQIMKRAKLAVSDADFDRRMATIEKDFHVEISFGSTGRPSYRLGNFKGFMGQEDHKRHEFVRRQRSKVS